MRFFVIVAGLISAAFSPPNHVAPAKASPAGCTSPQISNRDLARCMVDQSSAAVAHMLKSYDRVLSRVKDRKDRESLVASQRAWTKFKNDDCYFFGGGTRNGSVPAANYSHCLATLAEARAEELDSWPLDAAKDLSSAPIR